MPYGIIADPIFPFAEDNLFHCFIYLGVTSPDAQHTQAQHSDNVADFFPTLFFPERINLSSSTKTHYFQHFFSLLSFPDPQHLLLLGDFKNIYYRLPSL